MYRLKRFKLNKQAILFKRFELYKIKKKNDNYRNICQLTEDRLYKQFNSINIYNPKTNFIYPQYINLFDLLYSLKVY
jgi:hypothetical protein